MADKFVDIGPASVRSGITERAVVASGITAISKADGAVVTVANDFEDGDKVLISGCAGMTEINDLGGTVASSSASGFTVTEINSTGFTTYTGTAGLATLVSGIDNTVRLMWDNSVIKDRVIIAAQRAVERMIELFASQ